MPRLNDQLPANRLYRGEVTNFEDAMRTVIAQCKWEIQESCRFAYPAFDRQSIDAAIALEETLNGLSAAARKSLALYHERVGAAAKALYAELAASTDEDTRRIGEAAMDGDYSTLAI